ncbi:hypothetical protein [Fulvivirga imtechensis]|nr:hypothetical protein [Fulvivirga imtechensis]
MVTNKLNVRSAPKSEALISSAVAESQKGQAYATNENVIKKSRETAFIIK